MEETGHRAGSQPHFPGRAPVDTGQLRGSQTPRALSCEPAWVEETQSSSLIWLASLVRRVFLLPGQAEQALWAPRVYRKQIHEVPEASHSLGPSMPLGLCPHLRPTPSLSVQISPMEQ